MKVLTFEVYELRRVKMEYSVEAEDEATGRELAEMGSTLAETETGLPEVIHREIGELIAATEG